MRRAPLGMLCVMGTAMLCGCLSERERMMRRLGPAASITTASMDNLGWCKLGEKAEEVHFTAIVTSYDKAGRSYTDRQEMEVDLEDGTITSIGGTPQGSWQAAATESGKFSLKADRGVDEAKVEQRMGPTLLTLLHRLRGPYNLLGKRERARTAQDTRVDGQPVVRVAVEGDNRMAIAYYFDATLGVLKYVTAGGDRPGGDGTITLYEYDSLPDGVLFPKTIRVVRLGEHVLIGETPVFEVEISNVRF
ncbi:MAG TPA: hypothetical protein VM695_01620 [Phycisphaerae bacterium]|nr:hypothetical protein [Phycisphaerae bacterium]